MIMSERADITIFVLIAVILFQTWRLENLRRRVDKALELIDRIEKGLARRNLL